MSKLKRGLGWVCEQCLEVRARHHPAVGPVGWRARSTLPPLRATAPAQREYATNTAHLKHRRLIALHGPDTPNFLHGITTNTIPHSDQATSSSHPHAATTSALYSAFLTAQGRILHDVFIYPATHSEFYRNLLPDSLKNKYGADEHAFLVEVDEAGLDSLAKHLKRYKLRAKTDIRKLDPGELEVLASWSFSKEAADAVRSDLGCTDPRVEGLGIRYLVPGSSALMTSASAGDYAHHRHIHGVPEGQSSHEITADHALPHEHNLDLMHAVDFRKGCYVGQELTIRTQHKGVVRKRILPIAVYDPAIEGPPETLDEALARPDRGLFARLAAWPGADIVPKGRRGRPAGRLVAGVPGSGAVGLGMCRIEMMTDAVVSTESGVRWREGDEFLLRRKKGGAADEEEEGASSKEEETTTKGEEEQGGEIGIKAFVPDWVRNGIRVR